MIQKLLVLGIGILIAGSASWAAAPDGQEEICASPSVLVCDNFEARATGSGDLGRRIYKNNGWSSSDPSRLTIASGVGFNGGKALQLAYPAGVGGVGYSTTEWPAQRTVYVRWYTKWSANWKWSPVETKHLLLGTASSARTVWPGLVRWADPQLLHARSDGSGMPQNENDVLRVQPDRWYCQEVRVTVNTAANLADGSMEGWIDGVRHWNYPNEVFATSAPFTNTWLMVSGYWNCLTIACNNPQDQHPAMTRWHDNFVVSTQRIGCAGSTPPPPPPAELPAAPSNLTLG